MAKAVKVLEHQLWTRVDTPTKEALEERAATDDRSVAAVIRTAIRSYLAKGKR